MPQLPATPFASLRPCCFLNISVAGATTSVLLAYVSFAGVTTAGVTASVLLASLRQCCWLRSALLVYVSVAGVTTSVLLDKVSVAGLRSRCCGLPQLPRTDTRHYVSVAGLRQRCWLTSAVLWSTAAPSH